ncbi:MAG: ComF operon family protein [uncultured bacterium]|nr:MAG: ComF operon family protein [uncultured bacterium]HLD43871.1 late competence development ComFB family protein [bacterium]
MHIQNYMEEMVNREIDSVLSLSNSGCSCEQCRTDIAAWVLNRMPAIYVVSDNGRTYSKLKEFDYQLKAELTVRIVEASNIVAKNPRH